VGAGFAALRRRFRWLDHLIRAGIRFDEVNAMRLAAAITYYAFLGVFPILFLAFSVLGYVLAGDSELTVALKDFLDENLPGLPVDSITNNRNTAGIIGAVLLFYAGVAWVNEVRGSVRAVWKKDQFPGNFFARKLKDGVALLGIGAILFVSVAISLLVSSGARWTLDALGLEGETVGETTLSVLALGAGITVNTIAFVCFLMVLPRLRMSFRRVAGPALLGALGLEGLKTVGGLYIARTEANPAYKVVGGTIGLLLFLYLFDNLLMFCAALTATARAAGPVTERPPRAVRRARGHGRAGAGSG
jgi:membrane protein